MSGRPTFLRSRFRTCTTAIQAEWNDAKEEVWEVHPKHNARYYLKILFGAELEAELAEQEIFAL